MHARAACCDSLTLTERSRASCVCSVHANVHVHHDIALWLCRNRVRVCARTILRARVSDPNVVVDTKSPQRNARTRHRTSDHQQCSTVRGSSNATTIITVLPERQFFLLKQLQIDFLIVTCNAIMIPASIESESGSCDIRMQYLRKRVACT
jgi:hypothetical protein